MESKISCYSTVTNIPISQMNILIHITLSSEPPVSQNIKKNTSYIILTL